MIRWGDLLALAWRKLAARKVTTLFTILAISLGVALVTAFASLISPLRQLVTRATLQFAPVRPDVIMVTGKLKEGEKPDYKYSFYSTKAELTEEDKEFFASMTHVKALCEPKRVKSTSLGLPRNYAYRNPIIWGVPDCFMDRYWSPSVPRGSVSTNVIPVVVANYRLNVKFDDEHKVFRLDETFKEEYHLGKELEIVVGDNYTHSGPYGSDWKDGRFFYKRLNEEEYKKEKLRTYNNLACRHDMLIYDKKLTLRGKIVGFHSLERSLIPDYVAKDINRWLRLRSDLSLLEDRATGPKLPSRGGLEKLKPKLYSKFNLLIDDETKVAEVSKELEKRRYKIQSRDIMLRETLVVFDRGAIIAKRVSYAIGAILLVVTGILIWLIIGKSVLDSRREIGLLRAVGATKRTILHVFMVEAGMLGTLGGLAGLIEGWLLAHVITTVGLWFATTNVEKIAANGQIFRAQQLLPKTLHAFEPEAGLAMMVVTISISCLAGVVPALRAARLDPVEALRND